MLNVCVVRKRSVGEACDSNDQCLPVYSVCSSPQRVCACAAGFFQRGTDCGRSFTRAAISGVDRDALNGYNSGLY